MTPCDTLADVCSAIDQIDSMLAGLLAERRLYVQEAARFKPLDTALPCCVLGTGTMPDCVPT